MLRANVGLSRKLSKDYNSTGYSINLDGEITAPISDPEAVIEQVKQLFDLAEEALDRQIERTEGDAAVAARDGNGVERTTSDHPTGTDNRSGGNGSQGNGQNGNGHRQDEPATNKQVQYLLNIAKRQRLSTVELEQKVAEALSRQVGIYDLTKKEAATIIDVLNGNGTAGNRR